MLKKRLRKKNVAGETAVSDDYIEEVVKAYEHFFFHYTSSDLLVVNTNDIDFVERHTDLQELLRRVSEPIRGTQYFLPLGSRARPASKALPWICADDRGSRNFGPNKPSSLSRPNSILMETHDSVVSMTEAYAQKAVIIARAVQRPAGLQRELSYWSWKAS